MLRRLRTSPFFIKLTNWEYWPGYIVNLPAMGSWIFHGIRARSLFYFSAANPVIETGGLRGESKFNIYQRLPPETIPITLFIPAGSPLDFIVEKVNQSVLNYPVIAKPDVGERGLLVEKIERKEDFEAYIQKNPYNFVIQEYIDYPLEISVLHYRMPDSNAGTITSVCLKEYLSITGDGVSTLLDLILAFPRAKLQLPVLMDLYADQMQSIPEKGKKMELVSIGNHCRGAMFINGNHLIDQQLISVFDQLSLQLEGIYYGRFDMKCSSMEDLKAGKNFKILEFNGVGSDPAHIYHPGYPLSKAIVELWNHWNIIYKISRMQKSRGVPYMTLKEARHYFGNYRKYMAELEKKGIQ